MAPDLIISLKMQNDGYTVAETKKMMGKAFKMPWLHFSWGTDIGFFGVDPAYREEHLPKIKQVLAFCDYYMADSERDLKQAKELGLKGINLGKWLATGGFDLKIINKIDKKQERKVILVKGRQGGYIGKCFNVLAALHRLKKITSQYEIKIINFTPEVKAVANFLTLNDGIKYELINYLPYRELLKIYAQSKVAISATDVDGTPLFLAEAMAMGVFPIHSDMESVREWIKNGENGLLFPVDDIEKLAECIKRGLSDQKLTTKAKKINQQIVQEKMDRNKIRQDLKDKVENIILKH